MNRELFADIVGRQLWIPLLCIGIAFLSSWFIGLRLGLLVLGVRVGFRRLYPMCILGSLYSFWAKQLLPMPLAGLALPIFVAVILWLVVKGLPFLKYGWGSLTLLLTILASNTFIQAPLCAANPLVARFLLQTPWGLVANTALENIGPALALVFLPKVLPRLKTPLIPHVGSKPDRWDLSALFICFGLNSIVCLAGVVLYMAVTSGSHLIFWFMLFQLGTMALVIVGHFKTINSMQKKFEMEKFDLIAEKEKLAADTAKLALDKADLEVRVSRLEEETLALTAVNEQLKTRTIEPEEAVRAMLDVARRLQSSVKVATKSSQYQVPVRNGSTVQLHLTNREKEVLLLVTEGKSDKEIAQELDIDTGWAKNIIKHILKKTKLANRTQLASFSILNGLVDVKRIIIEPQPDIPETNDTED